MFHLEISPSPPIQEISHIGDWDLNLTFVTLSHPLHIRWMSFCCYFMCSNCAFVGFWHVVCDVSGVFQEDL